MKIVLTEDELKSIISQYVAQHIGPDVDAKSMKLIGIADGNTRDIHEFHQEVFMEVEL